MWTMARRAPAMASKLRRISCSRVCTRIWIVTSSGMRFSSISLRQKWNSVSAAEGNPISISLKPIATSRSKNSSFSSTDIGCGSAWLPSRRSTEHQIGARVIVWSGQVRSGRATAGTGRYFVRDFGFMSVARGKPRGGRLPHTGAMTQGRRKKAIVACG